MTKRIVSGIFILTALGALGVILAGALSSGEQLIVRFLTAVIVAALGLYVISDLRLQAEEDEEAAQPRNLPRLATADTPSNSTAAFMATVTQHKKAKFPSGLTFNSSGSNRSSKDKQEVATLGGPSATKPQVAITAEDARTAAPDQDLGAAPSSTTEHESAVVEGAGSPPTTPPSVGATTALADEAGTATASVSTDSFAEALTQETPAVGQAPQRLAFNQPLTPPSKTESEPFAWPSPPIPPNHAAAHVADPVGGPQEATSESQHTTGRQPDGYRVELTGVTQTTPSNSTQTTPSNSTQTTPSNSTPATETWSREFPLDVDLAGEHSLENPGDHQATATTNAKPAAPAADEPVLTRDDDQRRADASGTAEQPTAADDDTATLHNVVTTTISIPRSGNVDPVVSAADYADAPLAPIIDLRGPATVETDIETAIRAGELEVVATLMEQGVLSAEGPISDREVRTMVYVAFTSNELRKLLRAGSPPKNSDGSVDLGPVELFDPEQHPPTPTRHYPGLPAPGAADHEDDFSAHGFGPVSLEPVQRQLG